MCAVCILARCTGNAISVQHVREKYNIYSEAGTMTQSFAHSNGAATFLFIVRLRIEPTWLIT